MVEAVDSTPTTNHVDKNIFDLLQKLTDNKSNCRIDACDDTLRLLQRKQDGAENAEEMCNDLKYSVERLVKGLASSRDSARLGFALLLTEILKHMPVVLIEDVLDKMKKHLVLSKQEKRDNVFGQLFAYSAIVRSGRLAEHSLLSSVVTGIHDLWQGRSYILNACYEILITLFTQLTKDTFEDTLWPHLKEYFTCGWEKCSADVFWFLLLCLRMFPGSIPEKFLKKHWNNRDLFATENHEHIKKIFKQTTSCLPMLHPTCIEFSIICPSRKDMKDIWNPLVDDNLFELEQSDKSFVGFEIIKRVLQESKKKKIIECALSPKFRATFTKSYLQKKNLMNPAATYLATFLCDYVKQNKDPNIQMAVLKVFLQPPGSLLSDQVYKKKEVVAIIQNLLPDGVKLYCEYLKSLVVKKKTFSSDDEEENGTKLKGFQAVAQIGAIVCHPITISDVEWRMEVIKFLFLHSFFTVKKPSEILHCETTYEELTPTLRESLKSAFYKAIGSLHQKTDQKISPTEQFIQNMFSFGEYVEQLLSSAEFVEPIFPLEKVEESWQKMKSIVHKLNKQSKKDGKVNESHAFQALFLELSLHLFYDDEHMAEVLEELQICCKKALHARKHSDEEENDSEEPPWAAVVTDILLSLLSRSSQHLRHTVTFVFPYLIPFITSDALQQILNVISPENAEDPMLVDESDEESDAEFDSGSSSAGSDVDEPDTKVDDQFREKVKKALGHAAEVSDAESVVLSDSEMFKLDEHIAEAFRSRVATGHTQMSVEDKTMLNFRLRCLDLVIAFLKSEPPLHLVLQCVEPVLSAFELGHKGKNQEQLLSKVMTTFQTFLSIKKFTNYDGVQKSDLKALIEKLIEKSHKETNLNVAKKLYSLCVFLFLCSRRYDNQKKSSEKKSSKTPWYLKPYISALDDFVKSSGSNMYPQFFVQLMETCPEVAFHFISPCKEYAFSSEIRIYKKTQCLGLIFEALKFSKNQNSVTKEEWENVGSDLAEAAVEALKEILPNETAKPTYLTELLDIVFTCHTILLEKTSQSVLEKHKDLVPMLESMEKVNKRLPKKAKATRRRIILCLKNETDKKRKLNLKNTENKKQKTDSDNSDEE